MSQAGTDDITGAVAPKTDEAIERHAKKVTALLREMIEAQENFLAISKAAGSDWNDPGRGAAYTKWAGINDKALAEAEALFDVAPTTPNGAAAKIGLLREVYEYVMSDEAEGNSDWEDNFPGWLEAVERCLMAPAALGGRT